MTGNELSSQTRCLITVFICCWRRIRSFSSSVTEPWKHINTSCWWTNEEIHSFCRFTHTHTHAFCTIPLLFFSNIHITFKIWTFWRFLDHIFVGWGAASWRIWEQTSKVHIIISHQQSNINYSTCISTRQSSASLPAIQISLSWIISFHMQFKPQLWSEV